MEIGFGQRYTVTLGRLTSGSPFVVPTNSGAPFDLIQFATSPAVPVILDRVVIAAEVTASLIVPIVALRRSTTGTGGTAVTPNPVNASAPSAVTTVSYNVVSSVGTAGAQIDSNAWNYFAPYEFNQRPGGTLIPVSSFFSLYIPVPPSSAFNASLTAEFIEVR